MSIHFFNPYNDLALAVFSPSYTPPRNAALIAAAGAALPFWYGAEGDSVIAPACDERWIDNLRPLLDIKAVPYMADSQASGRPQPWGWSPDVARLYKLAGVNPAYIPDIQELTNIRMLSHRRTSLIINQKLASEGVSTPPPAVEINDPDMLSADPDIYYKSPWSSSGRGVFHAGSLLPQQAMAQAAGIIRHQGSVIAERALDKVMDFAMLFYSHGSSQGGGGVTYRGLSLFTCNSLGAYTGNLVSGQPSLEARVGSTGVPRKGLGVLAQTLADILAEVIGDTYHGPLGVDMMVYRRDDGSVDIAPCIELNLRNTMGHVALCLAERYLHPDSTGSFTITPEPRFTGHGAHPHQSSAITYLSNHYVSSSKHCNDSLKSDTILAKDSGTASEDSEESDYVAVDAEIRDRRLYNGEILLTPPGNGFRFSFSASPASQHTTVGF